MTFQLVDEWLDSTHHIIAKLSSEEIQRLLEPPEALVASHPVDDTDDLYKISTKQRKDTHPKSGKKYLGQSTAHNIATTTATLPKSASIGILSRPATTHSANNPKSQSKNGIPALFINEVASLTIDDPKEYPQLPSSFYDIPVTTFFPQEYYGDKTTSEPSNSSSRLSASLLLETEPQYKSHPAFPPQIPSSASTDKTSRSRPDLSVSNVGEVTFYDNIRAIDDHTLLPRTFQGHRITRRLFLQRDGYEYRKNPRCPPSPSNYASHEGISQSSTYPYAESEHLKCFELFRFSRVSPSNNKKVEVLCRLCRGKNWIPRGKFESHLALSHGIFHLPHEDLPFLLPYPMSMFVTKRPPFVDYTVRCPQCERWISLDNSKSERSGLGSTKSQGLYLNYFWHFISNHKDYIG